MSLHTINLFCDNMWFSKTVNTRVRKKSLGYNLHCTFHMKLERHITLNAKIGIP